MKRILLFSLMLVTSLVAISQKINVVGTVADTNGEALVGANVVVNNTKLGVTSNGEGRFELALDGSRFYVNENYFIGLESHFFVVHTPFEYRY